MSRKKVMIVEDDEDLHLLYSLYLQGQDFDVVKAFNGDQALELVEKENPDLIILDMIMPVMDGETFFVTLRKDRGRMDIPVIIASVNDRIPQRMFDLGNIFTTLKKPFTIETLLSHIYAALKSSAPPAS